MPSSLAPAGAPLVLVVEDSPDMRGFVAEALAPHYRAVLACDGRDGLDKAVEMLPDLIISDVMMPRMSGDEMVTALRAMPGMDDVPIIMLTAKADDELRIKLLREAVQDYVHKPFSLGELLERGISDITHPDDRTLDDQSVRSLIAGDIQTYTVEKRGIGKGGDDRCGSA